jgi:CRP-like cAMP-binding protein
LIDIYRCSIDWYSIDRPVINLSIDQSIYRSCVSIDIDERREGQSFEMYALLAPSEEHYRTASTVTVLTPTCQLYSLNVKDFQTIYAISPAIASHLSYEFARAILQDDFMTLRPAQEAIVLRAIEREQQLYPERTTQAPGELTNFYKVIMAKLKNVKGAAVAGFQNHHKPPP